MTQLAIVRIFTPPDISLPMDRPRPPRSVQLTIVQFSSGRPARRPLASRPDLMVMQSSPTLMLQSEMRILRQESGLMPSVLGDVVGLEMVTPRTLTFSQNTGVMFQNGEFKIVTPSTSTLLHSFGWMNGGRRKPM